MENSPVVDDNDANCRFQRRLLQQAFATGVLVDITSAARQCGINGSVTVTSAVWVMLKSCVPSDYQEREIEARIRRLLITLKNVPNVDETSVEFKIALTDFGKPKPWRLKAVLVLDDRCSPAVTIMFPYEE
jgi:hypothetical protein